MEEISLPFALASVTIIFMHSLYPEARSLAS